MAKITGSRNRYKRKRSKNPTSSTNRPARSRASSNSSRTTSSTDNYPGGRGQSRVTTERDTRRRTARTPLTGGGRAKVKIKPKSTGILGTRNTPATKTTYTGPKTPGVKFNPSNRTTSKSSSTTPKAKGGKGGGGGLKALGAAALVGALSTGSLRNPVSKAKEKELRKKEAAAGKKRPMSNIPPKEGTGKGSPNDKKATVKGNTPKPKSKPPVTASKPRSEGSKYKKPAKRTDKMAKVVAELKTMQERSKKRQGK